MTNDKHPRYTESVYRVATPSRSTGPTYERTDGRTNEEPLSPTRDNQTYVTRAPAYGFPPNISSRLEALITLATIGPDLDAATHWADLARALRIHCIVDGCPANRRAGSMCDAHYRQFRRPILAMEAHTIKATK